MVIEDDEENDDECEVNEVEILDEHLDDYSN